MKRSPHASQYFLKSPRRVAELIGHTSIKKTDTVLDIGAGSGVITGVLARRCAHVIAVENDPAVARILRANMKLHITVDILEADALTVPLPSAPYKVFANIPFHLSSPIVRRLSEAGDAAPEAMYLIVQKQFANKLRADGTGFTGLLGALIGPQYTVRIRARLRREDFQPSPAVDTVLVEIKKRDQPIIPLVDMPAYRAMVERTFGDPHEFRRLPLAKAGIPTDAKPSRLTIQMWALLFSLSTSLAAE